jgi:hypothetical protein
LHGHETQWIQFRIAADFGSPSEIDDGAWLQKLSARGDHFLFDASIEF